MTYELILTNKLDHASWTRQFNDLKDIINFINNIIGPIINVRFYDDDYPSIQLHTQKIFFNYYYRGNGIWAQKIVYEDKMTIEDIKPPVNKNWSNILTEWSTLLNNKYPFYSIL